MSARSRLVEEGQLLFFSYWLPPVGQGVAFVLGRVLGQFDLSNVTLVTGRREGQEGIGGAHLRSFDVPSWWPDEDLALKIGGVRLHLPLRAIGNMAVGVRAGLYGARRLRQPESRGLVAVYPKQHFLLAGCIAACFSAKPFIVYFTDIYADVVPRRRRIARALERYVARRADLVFVISEAHREFVRNQFMPVRDRPLPVEIFPPPYEELADESRDGEADLAGNPAIVFTGAVYGAQADAIRRLIAAFDHPALDGFDPQLHLFSGFSSGELALWGVRPGPRVHVASVTPAEARTAQRKADILFLPLAFDADPLLLQTASPSKTPEYLAAGRPVLVHAPAEAFLTRYAEERGFAEVVKEPDVGALAEAIARLASDDPRGAALVERGLGTLAEHSLEAVAARVKQALNATLSR